MQRHGEEALSRVCASLADGANAAVVASELRSLAAVQWDPYRGAREDWPAIYNAWLLLAESYRLRSFWTGTAAWTDFRGRVGSPFNLLEYACFGIWCNLWGFATLVEAARKWCQLEIESLREPIGPSESVVKCFLAGRLAPGNAAEWTGVRHRFNRGGLNRPPVHCDPFPYDVLAPELAWCRREGQHVPRTSAITEFPAFERWPVSALTERALVALATSEWAA